MASSDNSDDSLDDNEMGIDTSHNNNINNNKYNSYYTNNNKFR